jgi:cation diffusion facilitator family transporter
MTEIHDHGLWTHDHQFLGHGHERAEARAKLAAGVTAAFMAVEIAAGVIFGSMALLADGIHMATHVGALGLAAAAYWLARRYAGSARFTFGSGKFGDLAAFASAVALGMVSLAVAAESVERLISPGDVNYRDALFIAAAGLVVNIVCAIILGGGHEHNHDHSAHDHRGHESDNNLRAAFVHVVADAATSVLAILALAGGLLWGLRWLDPMVGIIGAAVIASWALGLIRASSLVLLDATADPLLAREIRTMVESEMGARVADLHLWRLGPGHHGLIVSLVSPDETNAEAIKRKLRERHPDLSHVTIEVAVCADCA